MVLKNGVKNKQATGFFGACTVHQLKKYDTTDGLYSKRNRINQRLCARWQYINAKY